MTRIYGTLGPACASREILETMLRSGMTGVRLNMSHAGLDESRDLLELFWSAAEATQTSPELLIDMQGPELRIGALETLRLQEGDRVSLGADGIEIPSILISEMERGCRLLLDDGKLELEVLDTGADRAVACVRRGGVLSSRKSIKIADKEISLPVSTPQDIRNIQLAVSYGVTAIMQPFVRSGRELRELRCTLRENGAGELKIFAKLETMSGVENLEDILPEADVIVIARGDLGNDLPLWQLPGVQKRISAACRRAGKPFIVVTQMLASMVHSPVPTRAEVSDIFNAVADGAWGVMLTNETAAGDHPAEAIACMALTAGDAQRWLLEEA